MLLIALLLNVGHVYRRNIFHLLKVVYTLLMIQLPLVHCCQNLILKIKLIKQMKSSNMILNC